MATGVSSQPLDGVPRLVRGPVLEVAGWVRRLQEATERLTAQLRDMATLVLRALDGVALQATQVRARSQVDVTFGSLMVTVTSGVVYARPGERVTDLVSAGI